MPPAKRIGIVGAGIAGCSLAKVLKDKGMAVTVFEMGRGAGGRMATRKSREIPGLAINHGAPVFSASQEDFQRMLKPLIDSGSVKRWNGTIATLDAGSLQTSPSALGDAYVGAPDMSSVCEALLTGVETRFQGNQG
ncbi:hypothetical protein T484DRAFT_1847662 [Baffinella frigidus]|nr:hypothetical protein T484DRAFT_1847662 [Cryptophyta sp. CCMP2293]